MTNSRTSGARKPAARARASLVAAAVVLVAAAMPATSRAAAANGARFSLVTDNNAATNEFGYAKSGINAVSFRTNAITTAGNHQFVSYYDRDGRVLVARRELGGSGTWSILRTAFTAVNVNDSHDSISIGVDGDGVMHMSWGVHNNAVRYARTTGAVTNNNAMAFGAMTTTAGVETSVTYPEFFNAPDGDLLYMYRTGSSGAGDTRLNRWDTATDRWSVVNAPMIVGNEDGAGGLPDVNAYTNGIVRDSRNRLHLTWTFRTDPGFQSNHDILYARSDDEGATWRRFDGSPYPRPFGEVSGDVVVDIPEQNSLINQTHMTVDRNDQPIVASWWAPRAASGNHTRQYMIAYAEGGQWKTSQITNRPTEGKQGDATVRDLGRPIVLVDGENRVIVVMRYKETGNDITIAYSEDRQNWSFLDLTTSENFGTYEPVYDRVLWERENKLHLMCQALELMGTGSDPTPVSVLEWDARAYFQSVPEPSAAILAGLGSVMLIRRPRRKARHATRR